MKCVQSLTVVHDVSNCSGILHIYDAFLSALLGHVHRIIM